MNTTPIQNSKPSQVERHEEVFKIYRRYIEHEDNLINHRTTWLITIQSFLWATFGFSYQKKYEIFAELVELSKPLSSLGRAVAEYNEFLLLLTIVGFFTSFVSIFSVSAASSAIESLRAHWESNSYSKLNGTHLPNITGGNNPWAHWFGNLLPKALPTLFSILWLLTFILILSGSY